MVCIYCSSPTGVVNSRLQKKANQVWRRRQCDSCGSIFTTHESVDLYTAIMVSKPTQPLEAFSRDKLFISIYDSLRHRKSALSDAEALTVTIITKLRGVLQNGVLNSDQLITVTNETLENFDKTAATVYRAYHPIV